MCRPCESFFPVASPSEGSYCSGWSLKTRSDKALDDPARMFNPHIRGWINYQLPLLQIRVVREIPSDRRSYPSLGKTQVQPPEANAGRPNLAGTRNSDLAERHDVTRTSLTID